MPPSCGLGKPSLGRSGYAHADKAEIRLKKRVMIASVVLLN